MFWRGRQKHLIEGQKGRWQGGWYTHEQIKDHLRLQVVDTPLHLCFYLKEPSVKLVTRPTLELTSMSRVVELKRNHFQFGSVVWALATEIQ